MSIGGFLKRRLELLYPSVNFEVVNLGVSAVNSYFIADIIDDVIDQQPDLILVYAGHNEYYGAFGVASNDIASQSPGTARFILQLRELKIYQLLSDLISGVAGIFVSTDNASSKTLMESMVGDNLVERNSDTFAGGVSNYRDNLTYIFTLCSENNIPVIAGELTSNLMQAPLENIVSEKNKANEKFNSGITAISDSSFAEAYDSLRMSKDLDALRFRAPSEINDVINSTASKHNSPVVKIDSLFRSISINRIPGYNLFTDHLHPNVDGYRLISDLYLQEIVDGGYVKGKLRAIEKSRMDAFLKAELPFTEVDSVYASIQISVLLNSYPFIKGMSVSSLLKQTRMNSRADTLAMGIVMNRISWEDAHKQQAEYYFGKGSYKNFYREYNVLIEDKPYDKNLYRYSADKLLSRDQLNLAGLVLAKMHLRHEGAYSSKMLGVLAFESKNFKRAISFLKRSLEYRKDDPETYFRLSAAYFSINEYDKAMENIEACLKLDPDFPNADKIYNSLISAKQPSR